MSARLRGGNDVARRAGFSLIEMLVVLAVLSVVTTLGVSAFASITGSYRATQRVFNLEHVAQQVFESVERDCAAVTSAELCGVAVRGERKMEEQVRYGRVPLENDRLILPISYYNPVQGGVERMMAMYQIERGAGPARLVRTVQGGYSAEPPGGASTVVAEGVLSIRFEFFDGKTWQQGWDATAHPSAVRCSVTVFDLDRPGEQISRSAAFPIRVR